MKASVLITLVILLLCLGVSPAVQGQTTPSFSVNAAAGVLLDVDSGQILFAENPADVRVPASLVKVMTMYIALDQIQQGRAALEDVSLVSERAWRMGGSQMFLEIGEQITIEELLFGISVVSGNDATVALAEALAGTESLYVRWMNDKAAELGLDVHFVDVHGLSAENRITAEDMAWLAYHYIREHPEALDYHQRRSYGYQPRSQSSPIVQNNRNGLLWRYEGTDGLKTGYLSAAGYNLVATATQNGRRLIAVILGAENERVRENEAVNLLNYGFRSFETVSTAELLPASIQRVYKGREGVYLTTDVKSIVIPRGTANALQTHLLLDTLEAPLTQGQPVGTLSISHDGRLLRELPLRAAASVERAGFARVALDSAILLFQRLTGIFQ